MATPVSTPSPADGRRDLGRRDLGRRDLGRRGEAATAAWYVRAGYEVVARNWRCRDGEIDLVVLDPAGVVVICEVKTRSSSAFGTPLEAVTATKQRRLRRLAAQWLSSTRQNGVRIRPVRFDVAAVVENRSRQLVVEVVHDAF
jgi:putative endonuclease